MIAQPLWFRTYTGEQIVERFASFDHDVAIAENWKQGPTTLDWQLFDHIMIQGIVCYVDRDVTASWLLMIVDTPPGIPECDVSYLALTFGGSGTWPWTWIEADDNLTACRRFIDWLEAARG